MMVTFTIVNSTITQRLFIRRLMALVHSSGEDTHLVEAPDEKGYDVMMYLEKEKLEYKVMEEG